MSVGNVQSGQQSQLYSQFNQHQQKVKKSKKDSTSTPRMMARYGIASFVTGEGASLAIDAVKFRNAKKVAKEVGKEAPKFMEFHAEKAIKSLKWLGALAVIGTAGGAVMKKQLDKNPDNKILNGINKTAKTLGWPF